MIEPLAIFGLPDWFTLFGYEWHTNSVIAGLFVGSTILGGSSTANDYRRSRNGGKGE